MWVVVDAAVRMLLYSDATRRRLARGTPPPRRAPSNARHLPPPSLAMGAASSKKMAANKEAKLAVAVSGIFFAFSYFAVLQEDVYRASYAVPGAGRGATENFTSTFLVLAVERGVNALAGAIGLALVGGSGIRVPRRQILTSGVSQMLAMASANEALRYVSYATQVLGKSCKMVPVMIGGVAAGRKFPRAQYLQVLAITLGVAVFNFGKKASSSGKGAGGDSAYGLGLIGASLVMDFVTASLQDRVKSATRRLNPGEKHAKTSMFESMLYTNASGVVVALALAARTGQLSSGVAFCSRHPEATRVVMNYALASVVGQLFIYFTITEFDPLVLSGVTTTRKIFSTVYSVLRDPDPKNALTRTQWTGCGVVFAALGYDVLEKFVKGGGKKKIGGGGDGEAPRRSARKKEL